MRFSIAYSFLVLLAPVGAARSLRRILEQVGESTMLDSMDFTCLTTMAIDENDCNSFPDLHFNPCVWCPLGGDADPTFGACVSQSQASVIDAAGVPQFQCGSQITTKAEDQTVYDDVKTCFTQGTTGASCLEASESCRYCVTKEDPTVGICFTESLVDLGHKIGGDDEDSFSSVFECTADPEAVALQAGSLSDVSCLSGPPDMTEEDLLDPFYTFDCGALNDATGKPCEVADFLGMFDMCLTATQAGIFDFLMNQMMGGADGFMPTDDLFQQLLGGGGPTDDIFSALFGGPTDDIFSALFGGGGGGGGPTDDIFSALFGGGGGGGGAPTDDIFGGWFGGNDDGGWFGGNGDDWFGGNSKQYSTPKLEDFDSLEEYKESLEAELESVKKDLAEVVNEEEKEEVDQEPTD